MSSPASASAWPPRRCGKSYQGGDPTSTATRWTNLGAVLRAQAEAILATDFFTVDLLNGTTAYVLAVIEHATRRIRISV